MQIRRHLPLLLALAGITLPFLHMLVDPTRVFLYRDFLATFLPSKKIWLDAVRGEGAVPAWNPYVFGGVPYWADLKNGVLYPLNAFLLLFPRSAFFYSITCFVFLHIVLMLAGMRLFLRELGLRREAALAFAFVYALSGSVLSVISMRNLLADCVCLPFFAYFLARWQREGLRYFSVSGFGLIVFLAMPMLAGSPEYAYGCMLYFFFASLTRQGFRRLPSIAAVGISGLALSAAQFAPGLALVMRSNRGLEGLAAEEASLAAFHPVRLAELILPLPFGNLVPDMTYWGEPFANTPLRIPLLFSNYLGTAVVLGLIGFAFTWRRRYLVPTIAALLLFATAQGKFFFFDFFSWFSQWLPFWKTIRYAEKLMIGLSFLLLIGAALGWQWLENNFPKRKLAIAAAWLGFSASACAAAFIAARPVGVLEPASIAHYWAIGLLQLGILAWCAQQKKPASFLWTMLAITFAFDMIPHARAIMWDQPAAMLDSPLAKTIRESLDIREPELKRGAPFRYNSFLTKRELFVRYEGAKGRFDRVGEAVLSTHSRLLPNMPMLYGISDTEGMAVMHEKETLDRLVKVWADPERGLDLMGAYYVAESPDSTDGNYELRHNTDAVPFLFAPATVEFAPNAEGAIARLTRPGFPFLERAVVEPGETRGADAREGETKNPPVDLEFLGRKTGEIAVKVLPRTEAGAGFLLVNETFSRHWNAEIGEIGKKIPAPVYRANAWGMAIDLADKCPKGCVVRFRYDDASIFWGSLVSLAFLILYLLAAAARKSRLRHP